MTSFIADREARQHEAAVAARRVPGDPLGLQHRDRPAAPRHLARGREAGEPAADDADVDVELVGQRHAVRAPAPWWRRTSSARRPTIRHGRGIVLMGHGARLDREIAAQISANHAAQQGPDRALRFPHPANRFTMPTPEKSDGRPHAPDAAATCQGREGRAGRRRPRPRARDRGHKDAARIGAYLANTRSRPTRCWSRPRGARARPGTASRRLCPARPPVRFDERLYNAGARQFWRCCARPSQRSGRSW